MASKKKIVNADPIETDAVQPETPTAEAEADVASAESEAPEPIKVKRPSRKARIEIGTAVPDEETMPESVPILPLRNAVLFPMTGLPLEASQPRSLRLIDAVVNGDRRVIFVAQKDKELEGAG